MCVYVRAERDPSSCASAIMCVRFLFVSFFGFVLVFCFVLFLRYLIIHSEESVRDALLAAATGSPNAVNVILDGERERKIYHVFHIGNIEAACRHIWRYGIKNG